jgi:lipopolysaccharide biosynthesis protein
MTPIENHKPTLVARYLPQFHPIPENDAWWVKGFTEWTNVARARALFSGHYQPHVPADLGFYDLRVPETRQAQAELARQYGIGAFCYYHYWFAGKQLLERPFREVLASGEPDFPFCLCWANRTWTGIWHGAPHRLLIEQTYPGAEDAIRHFHALLPAFEDRRYLRVDGKPMFLLFRPEDMPNPLRFIELWRKLASDNGLPGLHVAGFALNRNWDYAADGFDAAVDHYLPPLLQNFQKKSPSLPTVYRYADVAMDMVFGGLPGRSVYPCVVPNWDNTPRSGANGLVLHESSPELFRTQLRKALALARARPPGSRLVFVKAWNEWAEGNHLEPDLRYGHGYLQVIKEELDACRDGN